MIQTADTRARQSRRNAGPSSAGRSGAGRVARPLGAGLGLIALLALMPALLVLLGRLLPVDASLIGVGLIRQPDDGGVLLLVLLGLAWAGWATLAASVAVEGYAALRSVPTPQLPGLGGPQRIAAALVAALAVGGGSGLTAGFALGHGGAHVRESSAGAEASVDADGAGDPYRTTLVSLVRAQGDDDEWIRTDAPSSPPLGARGSTGLTSSSSVPGPRAGTAGDPARWDAAPAPIERGYDPATARGNTRATAHTSITTRRHDTLWLLAEQHLGDGARFTELVALNEGVQQPDGRALGPDGRIYPGWTLLLPADADARAPRPERHRVVRGDTLWEIADEHLGDPRRYPEVFEANAGDLQPDGRRLVDPDLIHPGWVLAMPDPVGAGEQAVPEVEVSTGSTGPSADATPDGVAPRDSGPGEGAAEGAAPDGRDVPQLDRAPAASAADASASDASAPEGVVLTEQEVPPLDRGPVRDDGPSASAEQERAEQEHAERERAEQEQSDPGTPAAAPELGILLPAGGTLATLLLAGIARELVRRRRLFQRHRRPGERMPAAGAGAREWEVAVRAAAEDPGPDLLERALADLARSASASGVPLPRVRTVRVTPISVTLDLADDAAHTAALPPFVSVGAGRWELDRALLGTPEGHADGAEPDEPDGLDEHVGERPFPGLVTVGVLGEETILIDLGEVGTLSVTGASEAVPGVLRALVSEVALGPAHGRVAITLCLSDLALSEAIQAALEAGDLAVDRDLSRVSGLLSGAIRRDMRGSGADPLEVVIADTPLLIAVPGRAGAALITTDAAADEGVRLELDGRGGGLLQPDGIRVVPQTLAASAAMHLTSLLAATRVPQDPVIDLREGRGPVAGRRLPPEPVHAEPVYAEPAHTEPAHTEPEPASTAPVSRPPDSPWPLSVAPALVPAAEGRGAADHETSAAPRILLLGEVLVEGATGRAESTRIGRLAETAAFVLLNPGARPSELQSALWPGRRSNPQTCRQMISRTRTWLGRTDKGEPYLMPFADTGGRLQLRADVASDWDEFQRLAHAGLADPADTEHLTAALHLVRGRPFGPVAAREIPWADLAINEMLCLITDVAHELALRHERAGRLREAREAALRGLRTETGAEVLTAIVARTAPGHV